MWGNSPEMGNTVQSIILCAISYTELVYLGMEFVELFQHTTTGITGKL